MSDFFSGHVLRPVRSAPSNSPTTADPVNGVVPRVEFKEPFGGGMSIGGGGMSIGGGGIPFSLPSEIPVETYRDMYRVAVLANDEEEEYLVWAANSSNLAVREGQQVTNGTARILSGDLTVGAFEDGTDRIVVTDDGNRDILDIVSITYVAGDDITQTPITTTNVSLTVVKGIVQITDPGDYLSVSRGDRVTGVVYTLAAARFWWTKNDSYQTRFAWDGGLQRWSPISGSSVSRIGTVESGSTHKLSPKPVGLSVGDFLPGDGSNSDSYAMIRVGYAPNTTAFSLGPGLTISGTPFDGVKIVVDSDVGSYDFSLDAPQAAAVVGVSNGTLAFNPLFVALTAGLPVWYSPLVFQQDSTGEVGSLADAALQDFFIAPAPGPTERPIITIGNRDPLVATTLDTDALLDAFTPSEGEVGVSRSTGRIKLSNADIQKAVTGTRAVPNPSFELPYYGAAVYYRGVTGNSIPQPVKREVALTDNVGAPIVDPDPNTDFYLPPAESGYPLGSSGVIEIPDGTGAVPNTSTAPNVRPNESGLVRSVETLGDLILFGEGGAVERVNVVDYVNDVPSRKKISNGEAYIAREGTSFRSLVRINRRDLKTKFATGSVYCRQADFTPASYSESPTVWSRRRFSYTLVGVERLHLRVDGVSDVSWSASTLGAGTFTAAQIAADMNVQFAGALTVTVSSGHIGITAPTSVEVLHGRYSPVLSIDLSGAEVLGFLPGWYAEAAGLGDADDLNWNPDNGAAIGMFRSVVNLDRTKETADFQTVGRFEDILVENINQSPVQFLDLVPLEDRVGFDEGVFFTVRDGLVETELDPFTGVLHDFGQRRFSYLEEGTATAAVTAATAALPFGRQQVVGESLSHVVDGVFNVTRDGTAIEALEAEDFILDESTGTAQLVEPVRPLRLRSSRGEFLLASPNLLTDPTQNLLTDGIETDYRLKVTTSDAVGWYVIDALTPTSMTLKPALPLEADTTLISYEIYEAPEDTEYDQGIIADVLFGQWTHLPDEVFEIRTLQEIGTVGGSLISNPARPLENGNTMFVRFGLSVGDPEASITVLRRQTLGTIASEGLSVPSWHVAADNFDLRVGRDLFTPVDVVAFSPDPATVEHRTTDGALKFGSALLSDYEASSVSYVETFRDAVDIASGTAQLDPVTGEIRLSQSDAVSYAGNSVLFGNLLKTDGSDSFISPLSGSIGLAFPALDGQILEVHYFVADDSGNKAVDDDGNEIEVTEQLPLFVRLEDATRISDTVYSFNPAGKTLFTNIEPVVYIGSTQANYVDTSPTAEVNFATSTITFGTAIDPAEEVTISYAVLEASGGETSYSTSQRPVWRPPFFLEGPTSSFTLDGSRASEFTAGSILRVGASLFFVISASESGGQTTVQFYPPVASGKEVGSRSPGNDVLQLISDPVATTGFTVDGIPFVDPDTGFLPALTTLYPLASFQPVPRGDSEIIVKEDVTRYAVPGHCVVLDGDPFLIIGAELDEGGRNTRIKLGSATVRGYSDLVPFHLSVRPVYPEGSRQFLGTGALVVSEGYELFRFGDTDDVGLELPGRTLVEGRDYRIDPTGVIELLAPYEEPLNSGQRLEIMYTALEVLAPVRVDEGIINPRYGARFAHITTPSDDNGLLGRTLLGNYAYAAPDSFYMQTLPVDQYIGEVVDAVNRQVSRQTSGNGRTPVQIISQDPSQQGTLGLLAQEIDLLQRDLVARRLLTFYNSAVEYFEQIDEASQGGFIGDRDGKFRFFVGRDPEWPTPGYEDPITGELTERNLWAQIFASEAPVGVKFVEGDYIVDPATATLVGEELDGEYIDPDTFRSYIDLQRFLVRNDVDDVVITSRRRSRQRLGPKPFGLVVLRARGRFSAMWEPSDLSRIYPEQTRAFTTLSPGIGGDAATGDPGRYTAGRFLGGKSKRTRRTTIGTLSNPVLGVINQIQSVAARKRYPRARVWAYSPTGFPELDSIPEYGTDFATNPRPAIIATPLTLEDLPIDSSTGFPDATQFYSDAGDLPDLTTGDPELSTPGFEPGQQVNFGRPDGEFFEAGYKVKAFSFGLSGFDTSTRIAAVYVDEIFGGCCLTLRYERDGSPVNVPSLLVEKTSDTDGVGFTLSQGDTILVGEPSGTDEEVSDPPTVEELERLSEAGADYRAGFDYKYKRKGNIVDNTLPSFRDPRLFGLKEILGQNPPKPLSTLEADVEFGNTRVQPLEIPALLGETRDDSGDYSLPYLAGPGAEKVLLRQAQPVISNILRTESGGQALYPDEAYDDAGVIVGTAAAGQPAATLLTGEELLPVHVAGDGEGPVRPYDLLLMETGSGLPAGSQGILTVGDVSSGEILPPRFVTESAPGQNIKYALNRAMVWVDAPGYASGVAVSETVAATTVTRFDISSTTIDFDDGAGGGAVFPYTGGLNDFFSGAGVGAQLILNILKQPADPAGPTPEGEVAAVAVIIKTAIGFDVAGGLGITPTVDLYFESNALVVETAAPWMDFTEHTLGAFHDFYVDVNATAGASNTEFIEEDRLTFRTVYDLTTAQERGTTHPISAIPLETELSVTEVETPAGPSTVNSPAEVNGGSPFTFKPYTLGSPIGTFLAGFGTLKVMAFEGYGNTPITGTGISFAAVPSSDVVSSSGDAANDAVTNINPVTDLSLVEAGDVLVINRSDDPAYATEKAGSYIVRYAIPTNTASFTRDETLIPSTGGTGNGWLSLPFPISSEFDVGTGELTLLNSDGERVLEVVDTGGDTTSVSDGDTVTVGAVTFTARAVPALPLDFEIAGTATGTAENLRQAVEDDGTYTATRSANLIRVSDGPVVSFTEAVPASFELILNEDGFEVGQRAYLLIDPSLVSAPTADEYAGLCYSGVILSLSPMILDTGALSLLDAAGNTVTPAEFESVVSSRVQVSGFTELPVDADHPSYPYTPGTITSVAVLNQATGVNDSAAPIGTTSNGVSGDYGVYPPVGNPYDGYADTVNLLVTSGGAWDVLWETVHDPNSFGGNGIPRCILPNDLLTADYEMTAGIYLEPSTPQPTANLDGTDERVVTATHSLAASERGFRNPSTPETVLWEVRRIRRWSPVLETLTGALAPLRYAYETRRGQITGFSATDTGSTITAVAGTQLGFFDNPDVNVNPGDQFRVLDSSGEVVYEREIRAVLSSTELLLEAPPITTPVLGLDFEVYLRRAPVPHEQSNQQLLDLITDEVVFSREADFTSQTGGKVDALNVLSDTSGLIDYLAIGVQKGDILIIDPAGDLEGPGGPAAIPERGTRPFGNLGLAPYAPGDEGGPSALDDNRGYYIVDSVTSTDVTVRSLGYFAGDSGSSDVILGTSSFPWVVYPVITGSVLTGGAEGQMDLRPTAFANGSDSFAADPESIAPFAYRFIRPIQNFDEETLALILMLRERMLSWIEETKFFSEGKSGTYEIFQRDDHIADIENPGNPESGLGVPSNAFLLGIEGEVDRVPFENTRDCLSVLDRRYFIGDEDLDADGYTDLLNDEGRPVLPDYIDETLNQTERLRRLRYAWLNFRANLTEGTLQAIRTFREELSTRLEEQRRAALLKDSLS